MNQPPTYHVRTTAMAVALNSAPELFAETTTIVRIDDEAAGEYVVVEQHHSEGLSKTIISTEEWPQLRQAIDTMVSACRDAT